MTKKNKSAKASSGLKGFDVSVNSFGEIKSSIDIDQLNDFLNQNVDDKKFRDRNDIGQSSK